MLLPFLKEKKLPRVAPESEHSKDYGGSLSDQVDDYCIGELMDAVKDKNVSGFRKALEALVLNCFEEEMEKS